MFATGRVLSGVRKKKRTASEFSSGTSLGVKASESNWINMKRFGYPYRI